MAVPFFLAHNYIGAFAAGIASTVGNVFSSLNTGGVDIPDYGAASTGAAEAEADTLADRRQAEAMARLGLAGEANVGPLTKQKWTEEYVKIPSEKGQGGTEKVPYVAEDWSQGGKYYHLTNDGADPPKIISKKKRGKRPSATEVDFRGYGDADIQGDIARKMAAGQLELDRKYSPEFIELSKELLGEADPESVAGREMLWKAIQEDIEQADKAERPIAEQLDKQLLAEAMRGKGLDPESAATMARTLQGRGGENYDMDQITENLVTGQMGLDRLNRRTQKGISYLGSGATPEDTAYRRSQQGMANTASFLRGETPVAQFGQLSGAQSGVTPFPTGPSLPNYTGQIANNITSQNAQSYGFDARAQANQVNPWMAGISLATQGAGTLGNAGWKPLSG